MKKYQLIFLMLIIPLLQLAAQDIAGSQDHKLITRFPKSKIISYYQNEYNELKFAIKPAKAEEPPKEWLTVSGKHTSIIYEAPADKTTIQIMKNYRDAILAKGGELLFECSNGKCAGTDAWYNAKFFNGVYISNRGGGVSHYEHFDAYHASQKYLVAKIVTTNKVYYLEVGMTPKYDEQSVKICIEIVEEEILASGLISVNADVIKEKMDAEGKIALYGIFFDTGKATLQSVSATELGHLITYLQQNQIVNIYIVGHTDDTGSQAMNQQLSEKRAAAVKNYLLEKGITDNRIIAQGVGPYAPVATNETEEGRKLNRRVEIVKRLK